MELSEKHIAFIENNLTLYGVENKDLREDLLDHICTYIEHQNSDDFAKKPVFSRGHIMQTSEYKWLTRCHTLPAPQTNSSMGAPTSSVY